MEIGVLEETGVDLHLALQHGLQLVVHLVPRRDLLRPRCQLCVRGHDATLLLTLEHRLSQGIPAVGELPLVLVRPLQRHMMRRVRRTRREIDKERLLRRQRLLRPDPPDRLVSQILGQVVALLRRLLRLHRRRAVIERRVVLVVLAADEPVELLEPTSARRPGVKRPYRGGLPRRHLVTLAELGRRISVQLQRRRQRSLRVGTHPTRPGSRGRGLGDHPHPDGVMVAPREQRRTCRRTQRGRVEPSVGQPTTLQALRHRHPHRATERTRRAEPDIVQQDHENIRCALRRQQRLDRRERRIRVLRVIRRQPHIGSLGNRQNRA